MFSNCNTIVLIKSLDKIYLAFSNANRSFFLFLLFKNILLLVLFNLDKFLLEKLFLLE